MHHLCHLLQAKAGDYDYVHRDMGTSLPNHTSQNYTFAWQISINSYCSSEAATVFNQQSKSSATEAPLHIFS